MQKPRPERGGNSFRGTQHGGPIGKRCVYCYKVHRWLYMGTIAAGSQAVGRDTVIVLSAVSWILNVRQHSWVHAPYSHPAGSCLNTAGTSENSVGVPLIGIQWSGPQWSGPQCSVFSFLWQLQTGLLGTERAPHGHRGYGCPSFTAQCRPLSQGSKGPLPHPPGKDPQALTPFLHEQTVPSQRLAEQLSASLFSSVHCQMPTMLGSRAPGAYI